MSNSAQRYSGHGDRGNRKSKRVDKHLERELRGEISKRVTELYSQ